MERNHGRCATLILSCLFLGCAEQSPESGNASPAATTETSTVETTARPQAYGTQRMTTVYRRLATDLREGRPLVVTSIVVLCENRHVACGSDGLGNGDAPDNNLYWGALYGLRTWFSRPGSGWEEMPLAEGLEPREEAIVEARVFRKMYEASGTWRSRGVGDAFPVYLVALAYRASSSTRALEDYFGAVSGASPRVIELASGEKLHAGGDGHVVGFVGHNYLMGRSQQWLASDAHREALRPIATFVLACDSEPYFGPRLDGESIVRLVMTHEFMAPEAYSLEAILDGLALGIAADDIRMEVVQAYAGIQAANYTHPLASARAIFLPRESGSADPPESTRDSRCVSPPTSEDLWIEVRKSRRRMSLCRGSTTLETHEIGLGPNPVGDKIRSGDGATPEGDYYVCRFVDPSQYYRALLISYPDKKDAARGLKTGLISQEEHRSIEKAIANGTCPPQNTELGGLIEIHGDGAGSDWTLGCVATDNDVMDGLFEQVKIGTRVRILP